MEGWTIKKSQLDATKNKENLEDSFIFMKRLKLMKISKFNRVGIVLMNEMAKPQALKTGTVYEDADFTLRSHRINRN